MPFFLSSLSCKSLIINVQEATPETRLCYITGISNKRKEPDMKFNELLDQAATVVPTYRQPIFRTLITALATGGQPGRISSIFRKFVNVLQRGGDNVVINGGLESGDKVVTTRLELMFEGMKVELSDG